MKKLSVSLLICAVLCITFIAANTKEAINPNPSAVNFVTGNPDIASINALAFGPDGVLFVGDSKNATIVAIDTKDVTARESAEAIRIGGIHEKIAASLGITTDKLRVTDMAVNPISKSVYFAVHIMDGTPVVLKLNGENLENVSLKDVSHSKIELSNAISEDKKDRRGRSQRALAISDLKYHKGNLMVTGLSNEEFSSTFRSIAFPFNDTQDHASLEIYHAAHGRFETYAPIKTFSIVNVNSKDYLMASYTCTPLVLFPLEELKGGTHIKGRTVAELGAGNAPLDMITIERNGKPYFLMSNTNRPVMRIDYDAISNYQAELTEPIRGYGTDGVPYVSLPMVNVLQLDNLDANKIVYLQRTSGGQLVLVSRPTNRV